jgi:carbonic anhydrase
MTTLQHILERNAVWAHKRKRGDLGYFSRMAKTQSPEVMWIGCSDSRVSASLLCGLEPGDMFVHRNVGNLIPAADLNSMSVLQYAVEALKVRHIVVCGHYDCGGVKAALRDAKPGLVDHWIEPIREVAREHHAALMALPEGEERVNALAELNVRSQVQNLSNSPIIQRAWRNHQPLTIHGWMYRLENGLLHDLNCSRGEDAGEGAPAAP